MRFAEWRSLDERPCNHTANEGNSPAVVSYSEVVVGDTVDDEAFGRRAMDKVLAQLAGRTTADIDQAGAMPAIVILGDNNTLCLGDAFIELLRLKLKADEKLAAPPPPAPAS